MTPIIPFEFDIPADDETHLIVEDSPGGATISWPLAGAKLVLPGSKGWAYFEDLEAANPGHFVRYGQSGFSVGTYHEFVLGDLGGGYWTDHEPIAGFKFGSIECTFGYATPLAAMLFEPYHREKYYGGWESIQTLRILGSALDEVEQALVSAFVAFEAHFGYLPRLSEIDEANLGGEEPESPGGEPEVHVAPPIVLDLEPMRFLYNGLMQVDDAAACISFYRVLEYFAFLSHSTEMKKLRHDGTVSDAEFSRRILDLVTKDEKGPIFKLVAGLTDSSLLAAAQADGLTANTAPNTFAEALYGFRNSIVHGKYSYGFTLQSTSVIGIDASAAKWRALLRGLAQRALEKFGAKKV